MRLLVAFSIFIIPSMHSWAQTWDLLTPVNSGGIIRNCSFIDEMNGYIVVQAEGDIYGTRDGGITWFRPWTPGISANLYDVEMVSAEVVMTCGISGEIFRSIDAGTSWVEISTPTNEYLYALDFVNPDVGFSAGFNGTVMRTLDGGANWELLETGTTDALFDIEFVDELVGFACGWNGTIVRTQDGGDTWVVLETGYDGTLLNCSFPSANVGFAVGWNQTILGTTDGGTTWTEQFSNGNNTLNFVEFRDEQHGWAAGNWGGYYSTSNGGATWSSADFLGGVEVWGGQYLSENCALLTGNGYIYKSVDNGASWELLKNAVPNCKYNGVYFLDDLHGYACGSVGVTGEGSSQSGIVYTADGGQTWDVQNQGFSGGWWDVHFLDEDHGSVIGGGNFLNTSNGGDNWSGGTFPELLTGVGIHRLSSSELLAGGDGLFNNICKSSNGGSTWNCGENISAKDFFFVDAEVGWAVSESGTTNIFHTTDGGENWEAVDTGFPNGKSSVFFLDAQTGWIGTQSGTVIRTTDGGTTWASSFLNYDIVGLRFYDALVGFAGDNQGNIWKSEDGGATWDVALFANDLVMPVVQEVHFSDNYAWAGCWSGEIYRAELGCGSIDPPQITAQTEWCSGEQNFVGFESSAVVDSWEWTVPSDWNYTGDFGVIDVMAGTLDGAIGLTITNACGLSASAEYAVEVIATPLPIATIEAPEMVCAGGAFTALVPDAQTGVSYQWSLPADWSIGNFNSSIEVNAGSTPGSISVYGTNACGQSETVSVDVGIWANLEVALELPFESLCVGNAVEAVATPTGGTLTGAGVTDLAVNSAGLAPNSAYLYTYTLEDENGCFGTAAVEVTFLPLPDVVLDFGTTGNCVETTVEPALSPAGGLLEGPGVFGATVETFFLNPGETYTYTYTSTDGNGCTATTQAAVVFQAPPEVGIAFPVAGTCVESVVAPELTPPGGLLIGDGVSGAVVESTGLNAGEAYSYTYAYTDANGCAATAMTTTSFNPIPEVSLAFEADVFCVANAYGAQVVPVGGTLEGPGAGGLEVQSFFLNPDELYTYTYSYTDGNGCTGQDTAELVFGALPDVTLEFPGDELCIEEIHTANVFPEGGELMGSGVSGLEINPDGLVAEEPYIYTYSYTAPNGCANSVDTAVTFSICLNVAAANAARFALFPNPSQGVVTVSAAEFVGEPMQVLDASGKLVYTQRINQPVMEWDTGTLAPGLYTVVIGDARQRLVVE